MLISDVRKKGQTRKEGIQGLVIHVMDVKKRLENNGFMVVIETSLASFEKPLRGELANH